MDTPRESRTLGSGLTSHLLDPRDLSVAELDRWRTLADRAAEPNPYFRAEYVLANALERRRSVSLIVVRDADRWVACLPITQRAASRTLPLPHVGALTDEYSLLGTPLIHRDDVRAAADALVESNQESRGPAALIIDQLAFDGPVGPALLAAAEARGMRPITVRRFERAAWRKTDDAADPGKPGKDADVRRLRRRARRLAEELGGSVQVVDRTEAPEAAELFLAMENSGWKAEQGTALASTSEDAAFFRRICREMAGAGLLRIISLEVNGRPLAMECHLRDGDALFSFKIAYDHAFGSFSPGAQLDLHLIEGFAGQGIAIVDTCASPANAHMNRLWPHRRPMRTLVLPSGARSSVLVRPFVAGKSMVRSVQKDVARLRRGTVKGVGSAVFAAATSTWEGTAYLL